MSDIPKDDRYDDYDDDGHFEDDKDVPIVHYEIPVHVELKLSYDLANSLGKYLLGGHPEDRRLRSLGHKLAKLRGP